MGKKTKRIIIKKLLRKILGNNKWLRRRRKEIIVIEKLDKRIEKCKDGRDRGREEEQIQKDGDHMEKAREIQRALEGPDPEKQSAEDRKAEGKRE